MSATVAAHWRGPDAREESSSDLWAAVARLVDRAPNVSDLISHKLELFAIQRWRELGRVVPPELLERERAAAVNSLVAPLVFERVRAAYGGGIIPMKGPVVAARYPDPALRAFRDLDLLVENPSDAHAHLLAAGFEEVDDPSVFHNADLHHLRPLWWPGLPLGVELHSRPNWPLALPPPPPREELFAVAEPQMLRQDPAGLGANEILKRRMLVSEAEAVLSLHAGADALVRGGDDRSIHRVSSVHPRPTLIPTGGGLPRRSG